MKPPVPASTATSPPHSKAPSAAPAPEESTAIPVVHPPANPVIDAVAPQVLDLEGDTQVSRGSDTHVSRGGESRPRLPHERDESADSQTQADNDVGQVMRQAQIDLERGLVDTSTGPVIDRTYERVKRGD